MKKQQTVERPVVKSRVRDLREQIGYTQAQLAAYVGVTATTIQNLEKDPEPLLKTLRLAAILGCSAEDLVEEVRINETEKGANKASRRLTPTQLASIKKLLG